MGLGRSEELMGICGFGSATLPTDCVSVPRKGATIQSLGWKCLMGFTFESGA